MGLTNSSIADATAPLCSLSASPDACHDVFIDISEEGQLCLSRQRISGRPHPTRFSTLVSVHSQTLLPFLPFQLLSFPPCIQNSSTELQSENLEEGLCVPPKCAILCLPLFNIPTECFHPNTKIHGLAKRKATYMFEAKEWHCIVFA